MFVLRFTFYVQIAPVSFSCGCICYLDLDLSKALLKMQLSFSEHYIPFFFLVLLILPSPLVIVFSLSFELFDDGTNNNTNQGLRYAGRVVRGCWCITGNGRLDEPANIGQR